MKKAIIYLAILAIVAVGVNGLKITMQKTLIPGQNLIGFPFEEVDNNSYHKNVLFPFNDYTEINAQIPNPKTGIVFSSVVPPLFHRNNLSSNYGFRIVVNSTEPYNFEYTGTPHKNCIIDVWNNINLLVYDSYYPQTVEDAFGWAFVNVTNVQTGDGTVLNHNDLMYFGEGYFVTFSIETGTPFNFSNNICDNPPRPNKNKIIWSALGNSGKFKFKMNNYGHTKLTFRTLS